MALTLMKIMNDCVFCKIVKDEIGAAKIWENDKFLAILDVNPNVKGQTLVMTKKHYDSDAFALPDEVYGDFIFAAKKAAAILKKGLGVHRVGLALEGLGVNHAHLKLYPLSGVDKKFKQILSQDTIYFEKYQGYLSTQLGPAADLRELQRLAEKIKVKKKVG